MTVLIFIDWYLPGYKAGGPIRSIANLVAHLEKKIKFKIVCRNTDYLETKPYENIKNNEWNKISENTEVLYLSAENINKTYIKQIITDTVFDFVYINGIYSFYFSILPLYISKKQKINKIIVASRGMLSEHAFGRKSVKKKLFLFIGKTIGLYSNITFHGTNKEEEESIKKQIKGKYTTVAIPNLPRKTTLSDFFKKNKTEGQLKMVSIARISDEKNTLFALQQLKYIKNHEIIFDIYGSIYDKSYWEECEKIISEFPNNITVNYKGTVVSEKVVSTFANYHFSFMPSKGENYGHSILESFMAGTPVITSNKTPWRDLENNEIGWDIDLENTNKFKEVINYSAKMNQIEYDKWSKKAFDFAKKTTNNTEIENKYIKLFA